MKWFLTIAVLTLYVTLSSAQDEVNENLVNLLWNNINALRERINENCVNGEVFRFLFSLYDPNNNGRIDRGEFVTRWRANTNMTEADTNALFDEIRRIGNSGNPNVIELRDVAAFYNSFTRDENGCINEANFKARWREIIGRLPNKGAQVPPPPPEAYAL